MAFSRSRRLCESTAGKMKGYRSHTSLALVDGGGGKDTITDTQGLLSASGFAVGDRPMIFGATSASNDIRGYIVSACASTLWLPTGTLATSQASGNTLTIFGTHRGEFLDLFYNSQLDVYSGSRPANADADEGSGSLLISFTGVKLTYATWDSIELAAYLDLYAAASATAVASGTAQWFRWRGGGVVTTGADTTGAYIRVDGTVGVGTGDLRVGNNYVTSGHPGSLGSALLYFDQDLS